MENLDVNSGKLYLLPKQDEDSCFECVGRKPSGSFVFRHRETERKITVAPADFAEMRCDGRAIRVSQAALSAAANGLPADIDPDALFDEDDTKLTERQRVAGTRVKEALAEARVLRFFVIKRDLHPEAGLSTAGLQRLIDDYRDEAVSLGLEWKPSPSAVRRAYHRYGVPGDRPLTAFLEKRRRHTSSPRWHKAVLDIAKAMIDRYWSDRKVRIKDAINFFNCAFFQEATRRSELGEPELRRPTRETLRCWINATQNWANWKRKYDEREANRKFRARGSATQASRILESVIIDHTRADTWAKVLDENGNEIIAERPWLTIAIDVHSRVILAIVLTYEPPSIFTIMECLRQILRPKKWLIEEFGDHMGASAWGKPLTIVLDNDWSHVGISLHAYCEAMGIDLVFAPVRCPEFRAIGERIFRTLNEELFHRLPGGIPHKPSEMSELALKPRDEDIFTLEQILDRAWRLAVTIYHMQVHRGIEMQPARAWRKSLELHGRQTVDDIRAADKFLGQTVRRSLDATGILYDGHRFHDRVEVSRMLDDMLRSTAGRRRTEKRLSSGSVPVAVTIDPTTCEYVHVWNYRRKRNKKIYNVDRRFSKGCSWRLAKAVKEAAAAENRAFQTDDEKWEARRAYEEALVPAIAGKPFREARKLLRNLKRPKPGLAMGDVVVTSVAEPSASGMEGYDVPVGLPAAEREDDRIPAKAPHRGKHSSRRDRAPRRKSPAATSLEQATPEAARDRPRAPTQLPGDTQVADARALLATLSADLD